MRQIPVDVSKLQILAGGPATPLLGQDNQPRHDRDGRPIFVLPVIALSDDGLPEVLSVRVPGEPHRAMQRSSHRCVLWVWLRDQVGESVTAAA